MQLDYEMMDSSQIPLQWLHNTRDRVVRLESDMGHMMIRVDKMSNILEEIHSTVVEGRGIARFLRGTGYCLLAAGGYLAAKLATLLAVLGR